MNGDGKLDLIASTLSGVAVLNGNGDGTFGPATVYAGIAESAKDTQIAVADLDGDGSPDIVTASDEDGTIAILFNRTGLPGSAAAPQNLTATAVSPFEINLAWSDSSSNITQFDVEQSNDGINFTQIAIAPKGSTAYDVTGLNPGAEAWYRVRAENSEGFSLYSNIANATTPLNYATTTALSASTNPVALGQNVTFTATVSGGNSPTGSVTFSDGGATLSTVNLTGNQASFSTSSLAVGAHTRRIRKIDAATGIITTVVSLFGSGLALDGAGNLYVAPNGYISRVNTQTGAATVVAGNGTYGFSGDGGPATQAELGYTFGVAVDTSGNLYIADYSNNRIRRVDAVSGVISTVVGNGASGYSGDGGIATDAELNNPRDVAFDSAGNLYIADSNNSVIRVVNASSQIINTVAGNGGYGFSGDGGLATAAQMYAPIGVTTDAGGDQYILDYLNQRVRKVDAATGLIATIAGNGNATYAGDGGPATTASFTNPYALALDSLGNIFVADYSDSTVREVSAAASPLTFSNTTVDSSSSAEVVRVANIGDSNLNFSSLTVGANFTIDPSTTTCSTSAPVLPGSDCAIGVVFSPTAAGNLSGVLTIVDNALNVNSATQQVQLSGTGTIAATTTSISAPGIVYGGVATVTVTVSSGQGAVTGNVSLTVDNATPITQPLSNGSAVFSISGLTAGTHSLSANCASQGGFSASSSTGTLVVSQAPATVTFTGAPAAAPYESTFIVAATTNASTTATIVASGVCTITGDAVTITASSGVCLLTASWPADNNFLAASATQSTAATQAIPVITWPTPAAITYGTALSATQLNAKATYNGVAVAGTFAYTPAKGAVLGVGTYTLSVAFTPTNKINFASASASVPLQVNQATPKITWAKPAAISYGTALSGTQLDAIASVAGTMAYSPAAGTVLSAGIHTLSVAFTPTDSIDYTTAASTTTITVKQVTPTINWPTPATIVYGTPLSATQLDATASVPGTFVYSPASGAIEPGGIDKLSVTFTPTDAIDYTTARSSVSLQVNAATPVITWPTPAAIPYGTALSGTQLDAKVAYNGLAVAGTLVYTPAKGTVLTAGTQTLSVAFTPTNPANFTAASASVPLQVNQAIPKITWAKPAAITYGTALSGTQLDATASVPGTLIYSPAAGTVLTGGTQTLSLTFTPTDSVDFTTVSDSVFITVNPAASATTITAHTPDPSVTGQLVTVTFAVTGNGVPTGTVIVRASSGQNCSGPLSSGTGTCTLNFTASGVPKLTAVYSGDINFKTSTSASVPQTVQP